MSTVEKNNGKFIQYSAYIRTEGTSYGYEYARHEENLSKLYRGLIDFLVGEIYDDIAGNHSPVLEPKLVHWKKLESIIQNWDHLEMADKIFPNPKEIKICEERCIKKENGDVVILGHDIIEKCYRKDTDRKEYNKMNAFMAKIIAKEDGYWKKALKKRHNKIKRFKKKKNKN